MLFDLRGRGRRKTVQGIYLTLAILMGGGLVLFGVGGNVSGGLLDALKNNPSSSNSDLFTKRLKAAEQLVRTQPQNAQAWANVVKLRYQVAGTGDSYDRQHRRVHDQGQGRAGGGRPGVEPLPEPGPEEDRPDACQLHGPGVRAQRAQPARQGWCARTSW